MEITLDDPVWVTAFASLVLAVITFFHLREIHSQRNNAIKRELSEKVYMQLLRDLENLSDPSKHAKIKSIGTSPPKWSWEYIKRKHHVAYETPIRYNEKFDNFSDTYKKYANLYPQGMAKINDIITKEAVHKDFHHDISSAPIIYKGFKNNLPLFQITFFDLILNDMDLDQYVEKIKRENNIKGEIMTQFLERGRDDKINKEGFTTLYSSIKDRVDEDSEIQEMLRLKDTIIREAKSLKKDIEKRIIR